MLSGFANLGAAVAYACESDNLCLVSEVGATDAGNGSLHSGKEPHFEWGEPCFRECLIRARFGILVGSPLGVASLVLCQPKAVQANAASRRIGHRYGQYVKIATVRPKKNDAHAPA